MASVETMLSVTVIGTPLLSVGAGAQFSTPVEVLLPTAFTVLRLAWSW